MWFPIFVDIASNLVIPMPHLKNSNKGIMYALYVVKKWWQAVKNCRAIIYSIQAAYDRGFKGSKHVQHVEWMSLDHSLHHNLSSHHPLKGLSPPLASLPWGFLLLWECPLLQGWHPRVHQMVRSCLKLVCHCNDYKLCFIKHASHKESFFPSVYSLTNGLLEYHARIVLWIVSCTLKRIINCVVWSSG